MKTYDETKSEFMNRAAAIMPSVLAETTLLDTLADQYPCLHVAGVEYLCALDETADIIERATKLTNDNLVAIVASFIPDAIETALDESPADARIFEMTDNDAHEIMRAMRTIDPTESSVAARVRDDIRNNFDNVTI